MRFFNTVGPSRPEKHYCLSPLSRFDLPEVLSLIEQEKYFILHAPRQTGKTTCLLTLMNYLNREGIYKSLYINVEVGQSARENVYRGIRAVLGEIASRAKNFLLDDFPLKNMKDILELYGEDKALNEMLSQWSKNANKPTVLFIDEIDSLVGDTLIAVLRQLRAGYDMRPSAFPQSIILCGVRDIQDYRIHSFKEKMIITGGSAFNVKAKSLRLDDFNLEDIQNLYAQHTKETGQLFEEGLTNYIWELTSGQPWLVNALGQEVCFEMKEGRDRLHPITVDMVIRAKENLIKRRETHLDQLVDKLKEDRVRRVIEPMLKSEDLKGQVSDDDLQYVIDLGLARIATTGLEIANSIYREIIPRQLTTIAQVNIESSFQTVWYIMQDGRLDMAKLMTAFQDFFREHSESWVERFEYKEAGPQLLLQAFMQRIINGGGRIEREYGLGRKRTDLLIIWHYTGGTQKVVIELKILYKKLEKTIIEGLKQTSEYMDKCSTKDGHLVIFDRTPNKLWDEKIFVKNEKYDTHTITVWGM
ncbi:MAG: ATP-binding protein [Desulfobacterales bacterium]|nr:ATP-binding protein [Desulfobacterales bacterium]MBF0396928.1 ATP-binding protein [Desulfobacterales bacterium]